MIVSIRGGKGGKLSMRAIMFALVLVVCLLMPGLLLPYKLSYVRGEEMLEAFETTVRQGQEEPDIAERVSEIFYEIVERISWLLPFISVIGEWFGYLVSFIYQNMYVWLDFIVTSGNYLVEIGDPLVKMFGVVFAMIGVIVLILNMLATILSVIPFFGVIPSLLIMLLISLPIAIFGVVVAFADLIFSLIPLLLSALKRIQEWFPPPPEGVES
jgi:hypothetical protein